MRTLPLVTLATLTGCFAPDTSLSPISETAESVVVAVGATEDLLDYGQTGATCFSVPGVGRGTGFAARPDLALGAVWTHPTECRDDACLWEPSTEIYVGPGITEDRTPETAFSGITRFDDAASIDALASIFATRIIPGAIADVVAKRAYSGTVDFHDPAVQDWLGGLTSDDGVDTGLSWQVMVFEWQAQFLTEWNDASYGDDADDDSLYEIDGTVYRRSSNVQTGYEVFACVVPL